MGNHSLKPKKLKKPNKVFVLYFLSFFLVILTPVLFLSISSYNLVISTVQDEIRQANMNALRQTRSSVDRLLNEIDTLSIQLGLDGRVYASSRSPENSYLLNDVKDRIKSLSFENMNVHQVQLYFKKSNQIISSEGADRYYKEDEFDQWIAEMDANPSSHYIWLPARSFTNHDGNIIRIMTLVRKIPVAFPETTGYAAIHIYEKDLISLLKTMNPNRDHHIYLATAAGELITAYTPTSSLSARDSLVNMTDILQSGQEGSYVTEKKSNNMMISYSTPNPYGWVLLLETPLDHLYQKLQYIKRVIIITCIILIFLGLIVSYYLSRTMYNPIKQLFEKSKGYHKELSLTLQEDDNTFRYVSGMFEHVVGKHKAMEASYKANYQAMVDRFIFTILFNRYNDSFDIDDKIDYLKLPITTKGHTVIVVEIDHYSSIAERYSPGDLNLFRFALNNIVQEIITPSYPCLSTEINDKQIAVLINIPYYDSTVQDKLKRLGERMVQEVQTYLKFSISVSVGEHAEHISQAYLSFNQASDVIGYKILLGHNKVIFFNEVQFEKSTNYYYPVQLEKLIINNIQAGNEEKIKQGLEQLKTELNQKQTLSYENVFRIYNRLLDAGVDLLFESNLSSADFFDEKYNIHEELAKCETVDDISTWMEFIFIKFMEILKESTPSNAKVEQSIQYMTSHYQQDLSVDSIAESVELNSAYLSRIFKQTTGKTILEYLTLLRIYESKHLLENSKDNIHEVAQKVGYNNINSFIRFFRKYEGITPGEYRKTHQNH